MLMVDYRSDIEHILHDLEQIEHAEFDDRNELPILMHSRMKAHEVSEEIVTLLHQIEAKELMFKDPADDPQLIEDMSMLAYYMSFYGWKNLIEGVDVFDEVTRMIAETIGCNAMSLINMKNMYDDYMFTMKTGWRVMPVLPDDMMFVMQICDNMSEDEVLKACQLILRVVH